MKYRGDVPFSVYADFKTTAPTDDYQNPEKRSMYAVSYCLVFAWHPKLGLKRQIAVRGLNHSLDELADISYLTSEQLALRNQRTAAQFSDAVKKCLCQKEKCHSRTI